MKTCVFVGRFQPFHLAHEKICRNALSSHDKLLIIVGSYRCPKTPKNPWSFEERREMILSALSDVRDRVEILPLRDFLYSDNTWITSLQNIVAQHTVGDQVTSLIGHIKDSSSLYLTFFPQWGFIEEPNYFGLDATEIRKTLFEVGLKYLEHDEDASEFHPLTDYLSATVPKAVGEFLRQYLRTEEFLNLRKEYHYIKSYRKAWENAPYTPIFVTTDAVVIKSGHVLLVRRKVNPGKGMFALPGGFLDPDTSVLESAIREVREETKLSISNLKSALVSEHVFDHPHRSARGRTITHGFFFELGGGGPLPAVKGGDDAAEAFWVPLNDLTLLEENFFEDHLHIIQHFITNK